MYLRDVIPELRKRGHQVDLLSRTGTWHRLCLRRQDRTRSLSLRRFYPAIYPKVEEAARALGAPVSTWVKDRDAGQAAFEMGAVRLADLSRYDLIHAHDVNAARALRRVLPDDAAPIILTTHGLQAYEVLIEDVIDPQKPYDWSYAYEVERQGVLSSTVTVTPSRWMQQEYADFFELPTEQFTVVPYGPRLERFFGRSLRSGSRSRERERPLTIACIARHVPLKGHEHLLAALALVKQEGIPFRCLLVGDGPLSSSLFGLVDALGLEKEVRFLGRRDDVPQILAGVDIVVLASVQEVTPLSIVEAQLAGRPVVATDITGVPELIEHEATGLLVPPADSGALAEALIRLARDPELRQRLGEDAQASALAKRTWEIHFARLYGLYHRVAR